MYNCRRNDARADDERISRFGISTFRFGTRISRTKTDKLDLAISLSQIEAANMQAIEALDTNYQQLLLDLEENYSNTINNFSIG